MSRADIHSISHNPDHNHRDKKQANPSSLARMSADFLPALHIRGSHYDIGHRMGSTFRHAIQDVLAALDRGYLHRFYSSKYGKDAVDTFLETASRVYPQYVEEMKGIASGANIEFMEVFLSHIAPEVATLTSNLPFDTPLKISSSGCSDLFLNTNDVAASVHSEDVSPHLRDTSYMLHAEVLSPEGDITQKFIHYVYPGCLPGNAFGLQPNGLCQSLNIIFQKKVNMEGIPRWFVNRAMCVASSIDEATEIAKHLPGPASGFNVNYAQRRDGHLHMCNLEVAGEEGKTVLNRRDIIGFDYHFNEYVFLPTSQFSEPSSGWRRSKLAELTLHGSPRTSDDLLQIIRNPDKFYRNATPPDFWATDVVALFDHGLQSLQVFKNNPSNEYRPLVTLPFLK